ncbi:hypothetical protein Tco_0563121, partial [Tanacetum coccineum]
MSLKEAEIIQDVTISLIIKDVTKSLYDVATGNDNTVTDEPDMEVSLKEAETKNG